ncbi:MAG: hypothetical protein LIP16_20460 [Clostridium sp.]|nr:hypothetical protein [Clostridium sp.]
MKDIAGLARKIAAAAVLLWMLPGLSGCREAKDRVDEIKAQGSLVAAVPEEEGELTGNQQYARDLERQVLEQLAADMGVTLRLEPVKEEELVRVVEQGGAHVAAGVPVLPGYREEGYSLTYGRRVSYLAVTGGLVLDSWGDLAGATLGYSEYTSVLALGQLRTLSGIEMKEMEAAEAVSGLTEGTITAYVCCEAEARELIEEENLQIRELPGLWPDTYTFYTGGGQYRLLGMANQALTRSLTE